MGHADMSREAQLFWSNVFKEVCESENGKPT